MGKGWVGSTVRKESGKELNGVECEGNGSKLIGMRREGKGRVGKRGEGIERSGRTVMGREGKR